MISSHLYWPKPSISGLLQGGWNLEEEGNIIQQISSRKHRANCAEYNGTIGQIATPGPIWYPGLNRIQSAKPNQENATVSACYFFPRKKKIADVKLRYIKQAALKKKER